MTFSIRKSDFSTFLLYETIMIIVVYLQQEFVYVPDLRTLDIIGEEAKGMPLSSIAGTGFL